MSVSAVSGGSSAWYTQAQSQPAQPAMTNPAEPFGVSTSPADQAPNIAPGTPPAGGHHGGHHHRLEMTDTAQLLGLSTSQLDQDEQSGTTLSSLASQDGVSSSSLGTGQSLAGVLATNAYANSATALASSAGNASQISQYS